MNTMAIALLVGTFFALILLGCHIAYSMSVASMVTLIYLKMPLQILVSNMVGGISGFTFLAIPFFIIMGDLMTAGGISDRLVELSTTIIGWMRGGLAMVNIVASMFFGGISGSAAADTASLGSILIPMMKKAGYDGGFSTAVTMASSIQGLLIPPSHNMVIFAMAASGVSVSGLFIGGLIPGLFLGVVLMVFSYIISLKRHYPKGEPFKLGFFLTALRKSIWALLTVLIVFIGVVAGIFTATESAAIAVVYSFFVSMFIYKEVKLKDISSILNKSVHTLSIIMILMASSGVFGFLIAFLKIPTFLTELFIGLTTNKYIIFFIINIILLLLGMILSMAPIIIITTPILLPVVKQFGMDPIQFGVIMILNCGIGLITPPVGGVLFLGSGLSGIKIETLVKEMLPFFVVMILVLFAITYIPAISMFLPDLLANK
jgi:tripartite ATP-independent transporter DctM subunit